MIPTELMYGGIAAAALGLVAVVALMMGSTSKQDDAVRASIEAYTRKGARKLAAAQAAGHAQPQQQSVTQQAVSVAQNVLENQKGLEAKLGDRLDAAGMSLKPAEWLLMHVGIAIALGDRGTPGERRQLAVHARVPLPRGHRPVDVSVDREVPPSQGFKGQLADTLQLMAGALSAGLSLAQSADTVVREGSDPVSGEFRRALVETRLGVEIEDALSGVADRMQSVDFEWVVMAIRIQREVGGNLSELLNKVAETIREREYLERQVLTLSAEGRLSVWILGGLPPAFMAYLPWPIPSTSHPWSATRSAG